MHSFCVFSMIFVLGMIKSAMAANVYMEYWLGGNDLPYSDFNAPDPYCKIQIRVNGGSWEFEGETEVSQKTQHPEWSKRFEVAYKTHTNEEKELLLKIYDKDYHIDDFIGEYVFKVTDLARINGNKITHDFEYTKRDLYGTKPIIHAKKPSVTIAHRIYSIDGGRRSSAPINQPHRLWRFPYVFAVLSMYYFCRHSQ